MEQCLRKRVVIFVLYIAICGNWFAKFNLFMFILATINMCAIYPRFPALELAIAVCITEMSFLGNLLQTVMELLLKDLQNEI